MASPSFMLYIAIGLLMVDSIIELSFISYMVSWLHRRAGRSFEIEHNGTSFSLHGKPLGLLVNQGHTSNGAAGTAFVLIGLGGILVLWMRSRPNLRQKGFTKFLYHFWLVMTVLSALLTLAALLYTWILNGKYSGQEIDLAVASQLHNRPYPNQVPYPLEKWTPENWFDAILNTRLVLESDRNAISGITALIRGWRINLIPMFVIGVIVAALAFSDAFRRRKAMRSERGAKYESEVSQNIQY